MHLSALPVYKRCSAGLQLNRFLCACIMQQSLNIMHVNTITHTHLPTHALSYLHVVIEVLKMDLDW